MRPIGFSTGALAYADFGRGIEIARRHGLRALELSALRQIELVPLLDAIPRLDLTGFEYISIHAPSRFDRAWEADLCRYLEPPAGLGWPVIVHPDAIHDFGVWRELGAAICVENMDERKSAGRTAAELADIFRALPDAAFCFDIGHARQVDLTMTEAYLIMREFSSKLRQVHVSEVNSRSKHDRLSYASMAAFTRIAHLIPESTPVILESPAGEDDVEREIEKATEALPVGFGRMVA